MKEQLHTEWFRVVLLFRRNLLSIIICYCFISNVTLAEELKISGSQMNEKITAVEQGLRNRVQIKNKPTKKMTLLERMKYYKIPGVSIAVINNGVIEWANGYGVIDIDSKEPVNTKHLFQAGSISKVVTAVGALKLVQEGKLSLDEDVNHFLKSWKVPENEFTKVEKVTLRRLLSHSAGTSVSGFPGYEVGQKLPSILQLLDGIPPANTDPVRVVMTPGTKFQYSGGGTTIVQLLIEDLTNKSFQLWMKEHILSPLEMRSSTFEQPLPAVSAALAAHGHLSNGDKVPGNWHLYPEMAAAGLWTTPSDLARVAIAIQSIFNGNSRGILTTGSVKEMLTPQMIISEKVYTGLGVVVHTKDNNLIFEHNGLDQGFSARLYMLPSQGQGVIIMTNGHTNGFPLMEELMNSIADVYHWPNTEPVQRTEISPDPMSYKKFIGKYYSAEEPKEIAKIYSVDDRLYLKQNLDIPALLLHPEAKDQYFTEENQTINFKQTKDGRELIINFDDGQTLSYHKQK